MGLFLAVFSLPAQTIITNFAGLTLSDVSALGTGGTPPDTMGAAGTNQFVEFINGGFAIYTKDGVRQSLISDIAFWTNAGISSATIAAGLSDTRIIYDAGSARWFATEITVDSVSNKVLVARSDSSNPAGSWKAVSFLGNSGFADYDTLGVDSQALYVGVNDFDVTGTIFTGVSFFSIPKTNLLATTPTLANMTKFENLDANTYGFTLQGVCNPAPGAGHGVMIAIDNVTLKRFDRTTVSNPGGAGATLTGHVQISNLYDGSPVPATQPGTRTIDSLDDRFSGAVKQVGGYIFMANTVTNTGSPKCAVHWLVMNETNNAIIGEGIITSNNYDFYQPSIAANKGGKMLLGFNRSGSVTTTGDISIYAAVGTWSGAGASMGAPFLIKQGTVSNFGVSGDKSPYRWGDFSATMADPTDDNLFWTIQEIPASSTTWGTQMALISVATNQPALDIARSGTNVIVKWPLSTDPAYVLQSNTNLLATNSWATLSSAQTISINQILVTLPTTNRTAFFRLKK
ncbi:MAG TPA: hypothetical protein VK815_16185 [Candidatus Acidoferrales bacterium]|nr:hypothetical protein [Candidatus Acidoferrales bacterium]